MGVGGKEGTCRHGKDNGKSEGRWRLIGTMKKMRLIKGKISIDQNVFIETLRVVKNRRVSVKRLKAREERV